MRTISLLILVATSLCHAGDWPHWRGPNYNGTCDATNLPDSWSLKSRKNVAWELQLGGTGSSTPIYLNGKLYLTITVGKSRKLEALCVDCKTGKLAWRKQLGTGRKAMRNTMATPSATTDGKLIYFFFGQGTLAALTPEGSIKWQRNLEDEFASLAPKFGYSSSTLYHDGKLFIPILRQKKKAQFKGKQITLRSLIVCIDADTGETVWKVDRPTPAVKESPDSYASIMPFKQNGKMCILMNGGDLVTCNDAKSGKELWRYDYSPNKRNTTWRIISSVTVAGDIVYSPIARGGEGVGIIPPAGGSGKPKHAWKKKGKFPDVPTAAYYNGDLYVLDGRTKSLTCMESKTGKIVWSKKLKAKGNFYASPLIADGKIYCISLRGEVFVLKAGRQTKELASFSIGNEKCSASIIAVDSSIYVRTPTRLIGVRNK